MTQKEQETLEKKALDQLLSGKSLFGADGAFAPMLKSFIEWSVYLCCDNFIKTIKYEWLYRFKFHTYSQLHESIHNYITWYNTKRLHSSLGYLSPLEMEMKLKGISKKTA